MPDLLEDESGFATQMAIWGYAVTGDLGDAAVLIAEGHAGLAHGAWDRTAAGLDGQMVSHGDEPYRRVRDWAALPWVTEHLIRTEGEWPGL